MTAQEKSKMIDRYYQNAKRRYDIGGLAQAQRDNNAFSNIGNAAKLPNDYIRFTGIQIVEDAEFEIIEPKQIENK